MSNKAREIVGEDQYEQLMSDAEKSLQHRAEQYDINISDEAVESLQNYLNEHIIEAYENLGNDMTDRLVREMSEPKGEIAQANISILVGAASQNHPDLRRLTSAAMEEKFRN